MTTTNHLNNFERLDCEILEKNHEIADELLEAENLDFDNTEYLANLLFRLERYDESIEQFERALSLKCDDTQVMAFIGISYFKKGEYEKAIERFTEAIENDSENESVLSYIMLSHELLEDLAGAVRWGERILKVNPKNDSAIIRLIDYHFALENYDDCLHYLGKTDFKDHYKKALILLKAGRYEECIKASRKIGTAESYRLAGKAYNELGNSVKAVKYLYRSYEKDFSIDVLFEISDIYLEAQDYPRAVYFLKMVLIHDEKNTEALSKIARAYLNYSKHHDAVEYAKKTIEINEKLPEAYITLADAYFQLDRNYGRSNLVIDEGISKNPDSSELWVRKGEFYYHDDICTYRNSFEKAISLNPTNQEIYTDYIYLLLLDGDDQTAKKFYNEMLLVFPLFEKSFEELKKSMYL